ncbi:hypothetical protein AGLY_015847 [Aphis glycines]|uniref:DUF4371 domain-containing protein n=1 Tax=Aphis glycines TaxID=307491 RepID=A0A6G0T1K5_APHGL|nr:hypothetical protein AGLY_015847 [Aphis glycines]
MSLPVLPLLREKVYQEKSENREVLRCLLITLVLAKNCIAFRVLSKYSPCLTSYFSKLETSKKPEVNFLSKLRQNQLISCCASQVKKIIKLEIKESRFFNISMDSIFDLSRKEQISFIVRYINNDGNICERLLALKESAITTSVQIFYVFQNICTELSLDWVHLLVGQSYDGAQNMKGHQPLIFGALLIG